MSERGMTLRGAVVFAILMGADVMNMDPGYILEKLRGCELSGVPECLLDSGNLAKFNEYSKRWEGYGPVDWDAQRDLQLPMNEVAKRNKGEKVE